MTRERFRGGPQRVALGIVVLGAAACAGILGIDDRSLDPELADGSTTDATTTEGGLPESSLTDAAPSTDVRSMDAPASSDAPPAADAPTADSASTDALSGDGAAADVLAADSSNDGPSCPDPCLLASGLNHPFLMTSDSANVYWTEFGDDFGSGNGYVKACPVSGCGSGPLVYAQGLVNPRGVAVDSQRIYFGTASYSGVTGGIWSCPLAGCGGSPTRLTTAGVPWGVAVDSSYVYWVDNDDNTVHKVAKGGGPDNLLYDAASGATFEPGACVVDGPFLFFMDRSSSALRLAIGGGEPFFLGTSANGGQWGIATDPANVYFGGNGQILRASKTVTDSGVPIADTIAQPVGLRLDPASGMIYWANAGNGASDGTVGRMAVDGGSLHIIASSLVVPEDVTVSGNYVFWLSYGTLDDAGSATPSTGSLWRSAK